MSERSFSQAHPIVVAHRGASAVEAENTLAAFEAAIEAGADAIEFDVRLTADGVPIVLHDARLERTTDGRGLARDLTADEVARLAIATRDGGRARVPSLEEALRTLSGRIGIDVELKQHPGEPDFEPEGDRLVEATLRALDATAYDGAVLLSSFNPLAIAAVRRLAPGLETGLIGDPSVEADDALSFACSEGHAWVLPPVPRVQEAGEGFAARAHAANVRVGTWVTDDPAVATALMRTGVDAVATNDPAPIVRARNAVARERER
jgi:glycerophosphoryl diester phosphodiesterase